QQRNADVAVEDDARRGGKGHGHQRRSPDIGGRGGERGGEGGNEGGGGGGGPSRAFSPPAPGDAQPEGGPQPTRHAPRGRRAGGEERACHLLPLMLWMAALGAFFTTTFWSLAAAASRGATLSLVPMSLRMLHPSRRATQSSCLSSFTADMLVLLRRRGPGEYA